MKLFKGIKLSLLIGTLAFLNLQCSTTDDTAPTSFHGDLLITTKAGLENFRTAGFTSVLGVLEIRDEDGSGGISNLDGLQKLSKVSGKLLVWKCKNLDNLKGLSGLTQVSSLQIIDNPVLRDAGALNQLSVTRSIHIEHNPELATIATLKTKDLLGELVVKDLPKLKSLNCFSELKTVGSYLQINKLGLNDLRGLISLSSVKQEFELKDLSALTSLSGLEKLSSTGGLTILNCTALESLAGLKNLKNVLRSFRILSSDKLESLEPLLNFQHCRYIELSYLNVLPGLEGLDSLAVDSAISIVYNQSLQNFCPLKRVLMRSPQSIKYTCLGNARNPNLEEVLTCP